MRTALIGTSAAALLVGTLLTAPAYADRVCNRVCHEGVCRSECVSGGPRVYMHDADRGHYYHHEYRGSGVGVEINR
jgi:hypothetical protein